MIWNFEYDNCLNIIKIYFIQIKFNLTDIEWNI